MTFRTFLMIAFVAVLLCTAFPASAQVVGATLTGNVTDSSGASVPGATIRATDLATGTARSNMYFNLLERR